MSYKIDLDYNQVRTAFIRAIMNTTGLDQNHVIVKEAEAPNYPRPTLPYIGLKILGPGIKSGDDSKLNVLDSSGNPTSQWTSGGVRKMVLSFDSYGTSHEQAYNLMALWQSALDEENNQAYLRSFGIAVWLIGNVEDLSALLETAYEGRAHLDCSFGIAVNLTTDLGEMDTVVVDGEVTTDQGKVVPVATTVTD